MNGIYLKQEEPKQETLEEAAEKYARKQCDDMYDNEGLTGASWGWETALDFTQGAKWQAERMYSEEDMKLAWEDGRDGTSVVGNFPFTKTVFTHRSFTEWLKEFKKK